MFIPRKHLRIPEHSKIFFDQQASLEFNNDNKSFQFTIDGDPALEFDKDGIGGSGSGGDVNIMKVNGNTINTENGATDTGTIRVCIASDSPALTIDTVNDTIPISIDTDDIFNGPIPTTTTVSNFPTTQNVNVTNSVIPISLDTGNITNGPISTSVSNFPGTQNVSVTNSTIAISLDTANITNGPISTSVSNFPATQVISGTVTANAGTNLNTSALATETTLSALNTKINQASSTHDNAVRTVLSNDYLSTTTIKTPLDFLTQRRAQLYWSSAITGGAISHNLALNFTLGAYAALTPPLVTSVSFAGSSVVYLQAVEMSFRITGGAVHNTAWGKGGSSLATGFGIYYKTSSGGSQIPIVNNSTATNQLPSDAIVGNSGLVRSFDEWSNFDPGAGDVVFKLKRVFTTPILMDNTGGYFLSFGAKEDLTANGVVLFHVMLHYRS